MLSGFTFDATSWTYRGENDCDAEIIIMRDGQKVLTITHSGSDATSDAMFDATRFVAAQLGIAAPAEGQHDYSVQEFPAFDKMYDEIHDSYDWNQIIFEPED